MYSFSAGEKRSEAYAFSYAKIERINENKNTSSRHNRHRRYFNNNVEPVRASITGRCVQFHCCRVRLDTGNLPFKVRAVDIFT